MVLPQQEALQERLASQQWTHRVGQLLRALLAPSLASQQQAPAQPSTGSRQAGSAKLRTQEHTAQHSDSGQPSAGAPAAAERQQVAAGEEAGTQTAEQPVSLAPWPPLPAPRPVASTQALALQGPLPRGMASVSCLLDEARSSGGSQGRISVSDLLGQAPPPSLPQQHRLGASSGPEAQPEQDRPAEELGPPAASGSALQPWVRPAACRAILQRAL